MPTRHPSPHHPVLKSRLTPPPLRAGLLLRPLLADRICGASPARLVLVKAPAGFGKTTLMAQCWQQQTRAGGRAVWLSLDPMDNDATRFLGCLSMAVAQGLDTPHANTPPALSGTMASASLTMDILTQLAEGGTPCLVFLDEFERLQDAGVLAVVRAFIEQLPPHCRLVIGTRQAPDLPLGRLRASGQLSEVDAALLRFSPQEAAALPQAPHAPVLSPADQARLYAHTEGWPAAHWLAALALERQADPRAFLDHFSGTHQTIADYLTDSVLAHQPAQVRRFLLRTSVLRQLTAPLCQALVPELDAQAVLQDLADADILVQPADAALCGYRHHRLFGEFLRAQLQHESPEAATGLHRAAAAWYTRAQRPVPAIDHALAGGDHDTAVAQLLIHAPRLLREGRMRLLAGWLDALPPALLQAHPPLQAAHLWAVAYTRGADDASAMLARAGLANSQAPALQPYLLPLQPMLLAMRDQVAEALAAGLAAIGRLPSGWPFADAILLTTVASMHASMGHFAEARSLLEQARRTQPEVAGGFHVMYAESVEGVIDAQQGRLRQSRARFKLALAAGQGWPPGQGTGPAVWRGEAGRNPWAGVLLGCALYEADDLPAAEAVFRSTLPLVCELGLADLVIIAHVVLARIAFHHQDVDRAFQLLTELEYLGRQRKLQRVVCTAKLERSRLLLRLGHLQAARDELDRADDTALWQQVAQRMLLANELEDMAIGRLRWMVLAGDPLAAVERADQLASEADTASRHLRAMNLRMLQAMALDRAGQHDAAHRLLGPALTLACDEGWLRLFIDEGPPAARLLASLAAALPGLPGVRQDPAFLGFLQRLRSGFAPPDTDDSPDTTPAAMRTNTPAASKDGLTRKEIRVLQLVADGHSDTAIAGKLFVSTSTVRTHLRSIYTKLGAHSRIQAVVAARRAGALQHDPA